MRDTFPQELQYIDQSNQGCASPASPPPLVHGLTPAPASTDPRSVLSSVPLPVALAALKAHGSSVRKIAEHLSQAGHVVSKSAVARWLPTLPDHLRPASVRAKPATAPVEAVSPETPNDYSDAKEGRQRPPQRPEAASATPCAARTEPIIIVTAGHEPAVLPTTDPSSTIRDAGTAAPWS